MNISERIYALKSLVNQACGLPAYFQLAPQNVALPYAVIDLQTVEQVRSATKTTNWQASINLTLYATSDTDCLAFLDSCVSAIDRAQSASWYFCRVGSVSVAANYLDKSATWAAAVALTLQWTTSE